MTSRSAALVLDDGELDDVVELLRELGVEFAHLRGAAIPPRVAAPERVLVTTPRRAMLAKDWPRAQPLRIAVVTEDSNTLRAMLRRVGFDLLLRRPVHPVALRLVLVRALYVGDEKRREERIALATEVSFRSGFRRRKALLADVSLRGCRILSEKLLSAGARISIPLPKELVANGLTLPCKVVRVDEERDAEGRYEIGLSFDNLSKEKHAQVRGLMKQLSDAAGIDDPRVMGGKARPAAPPGAPGTAEATAAAAAKPASPAAPAGKKVELPPQLAGAKPLPALPSVLPPPPPPRPAAAKPAPAAAAPRPAAPAAPTPRPVVAAPKPQPLVVPTVAESDAEAERRKHARAAFDREVARLDLEAESVLLGRDLSVGGMRVEYHPNLRIGDLLQLAIYASPREEPVVVKARVIQDAGDGIGLSFENVDAALGERLERIVARLPSIESLQAGEGAGLGSVVSRVLSGFGRED
jgi:hypothetical protein